ncbi:hypothetical protein B296_00052271 [Ensete ventricosum]|uniref:WRKY domain-containing protein n=1 Tax=Ensete ventricosum TaxID=4639 RepID=A0A426X1E2_ENSVE|nr:hypothetical protein B296_00052271 [Ensete ventricosum]
MLATTLRVSENRCRHFHGINPNSTLPCCVPANKSQRASHPLSLFRASVSLPPSHFGQRRRLYAAPGRVIHRRVCSLAVLKVRFPVLDGGYGRRQLGSERGGEELPAVGGGSGGDDDDDVEHFLVLASALEAASGGGGRQRWRLCAFTGRIPEADQRHGAGRAIQLLVPQRLATSFHHNHLPAGRRGRVTSTPTMPESRPTCLPNPPVQAKKKVVCHVPADGLSSDTWAWRKYGQKPIKDRNPRKEADFEVRNRGYYKCSSSKACLARKQVERSRTDPGIYIITYTGEHNHPMPTHRSALAGSTRHKFPSPRGAAAVPGDGGEHPSTADPEASPLSATTAAGLSPATPLTASMDDEPFRSRPEKGEDGLEEEEEVEEEDGEGVLLVEDMEMMGEDDLLFARSEENGPASAMGSFFDGDAGFEDHFLPLPCLSNCNCNSSSSSHGCYS